MNLLIPHLTLMMKPIPSFSSHRTSKSFSLYKHCPSLNCLPSSHGSFTPTHPHSRSNVSALHKLMSPFQTSARNRNSHMCFLSLARKLQFQGIDTLTQTIAISLCSRSTPNISSRWNYFHHHSGPHSNDFSSRAASELLGSH